MKKVLLSVLFIGFISTPYTTMRAESPGDVLLKTIGVILGADLVTFGLETVLLGFIAYDKEEFNKKTFTYKLSQKQRENFLKYPGGNVIMGTIATLVGYGLLDFIFSRKRYITKVVYTTKEDEPEEEC